jgi:hypothetical protein
MIELYEMQTADLKKYNKVKIFTKLSWSYL